MKENAIIVGAGPAGLTASYELLKRTDIHPIVMEESDEIGGISRTVNYNGNRMDIGGHRFFSKDKEVLRWWENIMQKREDDPDRVMLTRNRVSRIYFLRKFFSYPISLSKETFVNLGLGNTVQSGLGYIKARLFPIEENSLEDFYVNRFGRPLYELFFEDYTTKVWGKHPSELCADWGRQRVKGVSLSVVLKDYFQKKFAKNKNSDKVETSLIEEFQYPKYGPGQLWECVASDIVQQGAELKKNHSVCAIHVNGNRVESVDVRNQNGEITQEKCDYLFSSMPIKDLVAALRGIEVPENVKRIASELPYRDFITVGLLVKELSVKSKEGKLIPDTWIYIQERDVKVGRLQVFNNWSPYLVKDVEHTVWIGMEYFCDEHDDLWNMDKEKFIQMAIDELVKIDIIEKDAVLDSHQVKVKKAYPAYFGSYNEMDEVRKFLDTIENLFCIGRNGQHRYNNMDHSMLTAIEAVSNIEKKITTKENIWSVNTEQEYHETVNNNEK
ncbi:MAG: NAD(P)/FAD-dependent oxidoreductase [Paludibacteraceae bacterium]|nr:NAD(P)/FAD-dependent oxidoreductase [Paludibacteraceae bacterium]